MFKLLVTLGVFLTVALGLLGLRMRRLELTAQTAQLRNEIVQREHRLWDQEVQIAKQTNPPALAEGLRNSGLALAEPGSMGGMSSDDAFNAVTGGVGRGAAGGGGGDPQRDLLAPPRTSHPHAHHPASSTGGGRGGTQP
jgi:hypothetical protein